MNKAYLNSQNSYFSGSESVRTSIMSATSEELRIRVKFERKKDALKSVGGRAILFLGGILSVLLALKFLTI